MTHSNGRKARGMMLLAGGVIAATAMMPAAPAEAADKSKTYKAGAVVLGAASAYLIIKGKTVPGAIAGAGAYYAYKKSKDAKNDQYSQYPDDNYYSQSPDDYNYGGSNYPDYSGNTYPDYALQSKTPARNSGSLVLK